MYPMYTPSHPSSLALPETKNPAPLGACLPVSGCFTHPELIRPNQFPIACLRYLRERRHASLFPLVCALLMLYAVFKDHLARLYSAILRCLRRLAQSRTSMYAPSPAFLGALSCEIHSSPLACLFRFWLRPHRRNICAPVSAVSRLGGVASLGHVPS